MTTGAFKHFFQTIHIEIHWSIGIYPEKNFFFWKANSQQWWWIVKARGKIEQLLLYPMQYVEKLLLNLFFTLTSMWLCSKPHSSQFHSFCSMKCSCQMFQNFWYSNLKRILWKSTLDFFNEIWQILMCFGETFHWAPALKLGGVFYSFPLVSLMVKGPKYVFNFSHQNNFS